MDRTFEENANWRLYNYLCHQIGTEDVVRIRRLGFASMDYYQEHKDTTIISSGSKAEGLDMAGSDLDVMVLLNFIHVSQKRTEEAFFIPNNFVMDTENTKPGFTQLTLYSFTLSTPCIFEWCIWQERELRLSSESFKTWHLHKMGIMKDIVNSKKLHGPCISDATEEFDFAFCVRCEEWIEQAHPWVTRGRQWPSAELVSDITKYGVLFVPIGCKSSPNENVEWRISFSVAEKHLIYSFSHTQLLCYVLLKLLLKEMIDKNSNFKGLLCSYFLKTIMFWVSEELTVSVWRPENVFSCFLNCFKRLIYCITYQILPHFFIIENNLFENRFNAREQVELLSFLTDQYNKGVGCLIASETMSKFYGNFSPIALNISKIDTVCKIINTLNSMMWLNIVHYAIEDSSKDKVLSRRVKLKSKSSVSWITFYRWCLHIGRRSMLDVKCCNKHIYHSISKDFPYFIFVLHAFPISGLLYLASYYYCFNAFNKCIPIILYALTNCTSSRLVFGEILTPEHLDTSEREGIQSNSLIISDIYRSKLMDDFISFTVDTLTPEELKPAMNKTGQIVISPVVYGHFLSFLCWYKLHDYIKCRQAVHDITSTIKRCYYTTKPLSVAGSCECLGIGLSMLGQQGEAEPYFITSSLIKERLFNS